MPTKVGDARPADGEGPQVVVAVAHRAMRTLIVILLERDHDCWAVSAIDGLNGLSAAATSQPAAVIVDAADFERCCTELRRCCFELPRVVVIGPEPDPAYRRAVLNRGAGAWLSREHVAEELPAVLRASLDCTRGSDPPRAGPAPPRYPPPSGRNSDP
jgi:DNA-binding NarL/FixJ family response regulator